MRRPLWKQISSWGILLNQLTFNPGGGAWIPAAATHCQGDRGAGQGGSSYHGCGGHCHSNHGRWPGSHIPCSWPAEQDVHGGPADRLRGTSTNPFPWRWQAAGGCSRAEPDFSGHLDIKNNLDDSFEEKTFSLSTANCNTWGSFQRWRESIWRDDGGAFVTNKLDRTQHKSRHIIVVPEIHLTQGDIWKGKSWCQSCGLKSVWSPG